MTMYRCEQCGNKTRFDVYDTVTRRRFEHADLGGAVTIEDESVLSRTIDKVVCRWCDSPDQVVAIEDDR
jgi:hypothetical protein